MHFEWSAVGVLLLGLAALNVFATVVSIAFLATERPVALPRAPSRAPGPPMLPSLAEDDDEVPEVSVVRLRPSLLVPPPRRYGFPWGSAWGFLFGDGKKRKQLG